MNRHPRPKETLGSEATVSGEEGADSRVRLIAMGSAALTEGFALIGFETWPDARVEDLEELLDTLQRDQARAIVVLEPDLAQCDCAALRKARAEGGRVVITEVPPLHAPGEYHSPVEALVRRVLGPGALEEGK